MDNMITGKNIPDSKAFEILVREHHKRLVTEGYGSVNIYNHFLARAVFAVTANHI
jgi:hypothetical protein